LNELIAFFIIIVIVEYMMLCHKLSTQFVTCWHQREGTQISRNNL